jgi:hypothetical protein
MPAAKVEWYISYAWGDDRTPEMSRSLLNFAKRALP